jgi:phospholipase/carboxylesterase
MQSVPTQILEIDGWVFRQRMPTGEGPHPLILMLHGWTGDEDAMWVFASRLPDHALLLAPRGLYKAPYGGYAWHPPIAKAWPWVDDFQPAIEALSAVLIKDNFPKADFDKVGMLGFSQGAALTFSFGLIYPYRIRALAGLSGFMPDGAQALVRNRPLLGKRAYMAHGTQDDLVPLEKARQAFDLLEQAGAQVSFCEDEVGHKLSRTCFRGLEHFFSDY